MLEKSATPTPEVVNHIDRCLSCLACKTTCPSGVNYMRLVDHARGYIEDKLHAPADANASSAWASRTCPTAIASPPPSPSAASPRPLAGLFKALGAKRIAAALRLAANTRPILRRSTPRPPPPPAKAASSFRPAAPNRCCARNTRRRPHACSTASAMMWSARPAEQCCGSLIHHMGREHEALRSVRQTSTPGRRRSSKAVDAIIFTATGCGTTLKDYGFLLRNDPAYAARAARISALAKDITEFLPPSSITPGAHQAARRLSSRLLAPARPEDHDPAQSPAASGRLHRRHARRTPTSAAARPEPTTSCSRKSPTSSATARRRASKRLKPDVIATGNIGCAVQIAARTGTPVVHVAELLDWATGGPEPAALKPINLKIGT